MRYKIAEAENIDCKDFENIKSICLGSGRLYYVLCDDMPYLSVEVDIFSVFSSAVIFYGYLVIGNYYDGVYIIDLNDLSVKKKDIYGYFGDFEVTENVLYVLGGENITAYDKELNEIWVSDALAVDGIVCGGIENGAMDISCEMDPPGGWVDRKIDITSGKIFR